MKDNIVPIAIVVVLVLGGVGWWAYSSNSTPTPSPAPEVSQAQPVPTPAGTVASSEPATESSVKEFTVTGSKFKFEPAQISVKKGDKVRVVFKNAEGMHDFIIDEFKAKTKQIKEKESETIEFVADKAGSFEYYCSVGTHRALGMKGTLVVE